MSEVMLEPVAVTRPLSFLPGLALKNHGKGNAVLFLRRFILNIIEYYSQTRSLFRFDYLLIIELDLNN